MIALTSSPDGRGLAARRSATRRSGSTTSGPASTCRAGSRELLEANPGARAVLLEQHGLVTWGETRRGELPEHARDRRPRRRSDRRRRPDGRLGLGGPKVAAARGRERGRAARGRAARAARRPARRRRRRRARGRPEPGGGRVRLVGACARGQPGRRAVPRPPDPHEAQAARRSSSTPAGTARTSSRAAFRRGVDEYAAWYRGYYERNLTDESRAVPHRPGGAARRPRPGRRDRHERRRRRPRAARARPLPPRDRGRRTRRTRSAASARSARTRRSRSSTGRSSATSWRRRRRAASSPAGSHWSPAARAASAGRPRACSPSGARTSSSPTSTPTAPAAVAEQIAAAHGARRALAVPVDVTDEEAVAEMVRRTVLAYGGLDILVASAGLASSAPDHRDDARRLGAATTRCSPAATSSPPARLPRPRRAGPRRLDRLRRLQERARRRRERLGVLVRQGGRASPRPLPGRGGRQRTASASTPSTRTPSSRARASGRRSGRPSGRARTASPRTTCRPSTAAAPCSASTSSRRTSPRRSSSSPARARAKSTGNVVNVDGGVTAAYPR